MKRSARVVPVLAALALIAAACGDDDDGGTDTTSGGQPGTTAAGEGPATTTAGTDATGTTTAGSPAPVTTAADASATTTAGTDAAEDMMSVVRNDPLAGAEGSGLTRGVTDDSVKIGCVYKAADYIGFEDGVRAIFERVNASGGVLGTRTVDFLGCEDSGGDPTQIQSLYKQLVEQEEVFGILTIDATIPQAAFDYLNANEVPYTGWGYLPGFCGTRWGFGWNGCIGGTQLTEAVPHAVNQDNLFQGLVDAAGLDPAETKVFIQLDDGPAGTGNQETFSRSIEDAGATVVGSETDIPVATPPSDYNPFVQNAIESGANVVIVGLAFANVGGYTAALKAAGFEGQILNYVAYVPGLLQASPQLAQAIDGSYTSAQVVPQESQTEFIKQMEQDLTAIDAENGSFITLGAGLGYYEAGLMVTLLQAAGEDLNTQTFDQAVNGEGVEVDPGLEGSIGVTHWPEMHFLPTDCAAVVQVTGEAYEVAEDFTCYESTRIR